MKNDMAVRTGMQTGIVMLTMMMMVMWIHSWMCMGM